MNSPAGISLNFMPMLLVKSFGGSADETSPDASIIVRRVNSRAVRCMVHPNARLFQINRRTIRSYVAAFRKPMGSCFPAGLNQRTS